MANQVVEGIVNFVRGMVQIFVILMPDPRRGVRTGIVGIHE
jgi:hypothetical protein